MSNNEELQLVGVGGGGTMWHAIRHPDGSWTPFGNVDAVVGRPGSVFLAQAAGIAEELHLIALTQGAIANNGTIWHAIRHPDGSWTAFGNVNQVVGNPGGLGGFHWGAVAGVAGELHLAGLTSDIGGLNGTIWHAIRHPDGSWTPFGNVNEVVGHPGSFHAVALAEVAGELHLAGLALPPFASGGTIWHAIRHADGSWTPFGNVDAVVGEPGGPFVAVALAGVPAALAGVAGELHLAGLDSRGTIWHAIRHADGTWTPFGNVDAVVGEPGGPFFSSALAGVAGELHLAGMASPGTIWHAIRHPDGSWTPFGNVNQVVGGGPFFRVALASVGAPG